MNKPSFNECINSLQCLHNEYERLVKDMTTKNSDLIKVIATIRSSLERAVKNPSTLNEAVYSSIDLCRANFKYMDYSSGQLKQDQPLSDEEKVLP